MNNLLVVALLVVTGTVAYKLSPLQGQRPPVFEAPLRLKSTGEDVEARLWQDPVGAVAEEANKKFGACRSGTKDASRRGKDSHCLSPLSIEDYSTTTVLLATVPGGPYSVDEETRRRAMPWYPR